MTLNDKIMDINNVKMLQVREVKKSIKDLKEEFKERYTPSLFGELQNIINKKFGDALCTEQESEEEK